MVTLNHLALAVTGGDLEWLKDTSGNTLFVLAFGQQYDGEYTPGGGLVNQNYSDGVRVFTFTYPPNSSKPSGINFVTSVPNPPGTQMDPENQFHRRDLTMKVSVDASGNRRLVAYGGVFKGGRFEGFLNPVFVTPCANTVPPCATTVAVTPNTSISQLMSQYDTAAIQLFDNTAKIMYTTLLGGISYYYWNAPTNSLKHDQLDLSKGIDGLPFINSISTLKMAIDGTGAQYLHVGQLMPPVPATCPGQGEIVAPLSGAESKFVIASGVPQLTPGVITLSSLTNATTVGYLVGGINATQPYSSMGPTCASDMFYVVTINPTQPTNTIQLQAPPG
jgi:hypothetical protein